MAPHLTHDEFFLRIAELFENCQKKDHGSISLSQKRMTFDQPSDIVTASTFSDAFPDLHPSKPLPLIIRATNGKAKEGTKKEKVNLSTIVDPDQLEVFFQRYAEVCKSAMVGLKKRDRSKTKAKQKAKKRKDLVPSDEGKIA